jgi:hypothetical protein
VRDRDNRDLTRRQPDQIPSTRTGALFASLGKNNWSP